MDADLLLRALTIITTITLFLCLFGVGLFILPYLALLWVLCLILNVSVGGGIVLAGLVVAFAIYWSLKKRPRGGG